MDLETLKEKLGDETFSQLEVYVTELTSQRDQARNESISGRKGLKASLATLESQNTTLMEKLGISDIDGLDDLPDAKGAADAVKQFETKVAKLERQLAQAGKDGEAIAEKYNASRKKVAVSEAMAGHDFAATDMISEFVGNRTVWEDDELLFKSEDGTLVSVKDGVAGVAKSRPELLSSKGTGGAGVNSSNARGNDGGKTMTRAEFEALPQDKRAEFSTSGGTLQ